MARKDDYENAFRLAAEELQVKDPGLVAERSGARWEKDAGALHLEFIGRPHDVFLPEVRVGYADDAEAEVPLTEQVLLLHYLNSADGAPLRGEEITYREVPGGEFYYPAFVKRAEAPMLSVFGPRPELLPEVAPEIGGAPLDETGDAAAVFPALPRAPVKLVVWGGDDEFEPDGRILFDRSIHHYLSTEDVAWLAGMIVYRLMRLASGRT